MILDFDKLNRFETPTLTLCYPDSAVIKVDNDITLYRNVGKINDVTPPKFIFNFNAVSELDFICDYKKSNIALADAQSDKIFKSIQNKMYVYAENYGYFLIGEVQKKYSKGVWTKEVKAYSAENELNYAPLPYVSSADDIQLYTLDVLLAKVLNSSTNTFKTRWTVNSIDSSIVNTANSALSVKRAFDDVSSKYIYGFLVNEIQTAFECIVDFDIINRQINVYSLANYTKLKITSIHLSHSNFINELTMSETTEDLYTALSVNGDNDLDIVAANPLGTNVIYNFDPYLDWMSAGLIYGLECWKVNLEKVQSAYIEAVKNSADTTTIVNSAQFNNFLTPDEILELSSYVYQADYDDSYVTITDTMSTSEKVDQALILYNRVKEHLATASINLREFSITTENFVFVKEFQPFTKQLSSGCLIYVETDDDAMEQLHLTAFEVDFDKCTLSLTFGNKYCKTDINSLYEDVLKDSKGEKGATGATGAQGNAFTYDDFTPEQLASLKYTGYVFQQISSSSSWAITHSLGKYPSVTIVDSGGNVVEGDVTYLSTSSLKVDFTASFSGCAYLN